MNIPVDMKDESLVIKSIMDNNYVAFVEHKASSSSSDKPEFVVVKTECNEEVQSYDIVVKSEPIPSDDEPDMIPTLENHYLAALGNNSEDQSNTDTNITVKNEQLDLPLDPICILLCDICRQSCFTPEDLIAHRYTHTEDTDFTCLICCTRYDFKEVLDRHMSSFHFVLSYFASNFNYDERPYVCEICGKRFSQMHHVEQHVMCIHTDEKPNTSANVPQIRILIGPNALACTVCSKQFKRKSHLARHHFIHTGEKPHECDVCHKRFATTVHLSTHKRVHSEDRPYKCEICPKQFRRSSHLSQHYRTHVDEKPFVCKLCPVRFRKHHLLVEHRQAHTGRQLYECDVCHRQFRRKDQLNAHARTHTGEKPFECVICYKRFARKGMLTRHALIHDAEKPYKCDICVKQFTTSAALNLHKHIHNSELIK